MEKLNFFTICKSHLFITDRGQAPFCEWIPHPVLFLIVLFLITLFLSSFYFLPFLATNCRRTCGPGWCGGTPRGEHALVPEWEGAERLRWCSGCPHHHLRNLPHRCPQKLHCGMISVSGPDACRVCGQHTSHCDTSQGMRKAQEFNLGECVCNNLYLKFFESSHTFLRPLTTKFSSQHCVLRPRPMAGAVSRMVQMLLCWVEFPWWDISMVSSIKSWI